MTFIRLTQGSGSFYLFLHVPLLTNMTIEYGSDGDIYKYVSNACINKLCTNNNNL